MVLMLSGRMGSWSDWGLDCVGVLSGDYGF